MRQPVRFWEPAQSQGTFGKGTVLWQNRVSLLSQKPGHGKRIREFAHWPSFQQSHRQATPFLDKTGMKTPCRVEPQRRHVTRDVIQKKTLGTTEWSTDTTSSWAVATPCHGARLCQFCAKCFCIQLRLVAQFLPEIGCNMPNYGHKWP